jgi:hypothetical protein
MKKVISLLAAMCFVQFGLAQHKLTDDVEPPLNGPVKQITIYIFPNASSENMDTSKYVQKVVKKFDAKKYETEEYAYNKGGVLLYKNIFKYLGDTTVIKKQFDWQGMLTKTYTYKFDAKTGKKMELDTRTEGNTHRNALLDEIHYNYSGEHGFNESDTEYLNGNVVNINNNTNVILKHKSSKKQHINLILPNEANTTCEYKKPDKHGNWQVFISDTKSTASFPETDIKTITLRQIVYYKIKS